jgi:hypothetical protein
MIQERGAVHPPNRTNENDRAVLGMPYFWQEGNLSKVQSESLLNQIKHVAALTPVFPSSFFVPFAADRFFQDQQERV